MRKRRFSLAAALLALTLVSISAAIVVTMLTRGRNADIRILDSRFHIVNYQTCRGTNFTVFFEATQEEALLRDRLRQSGLPVKASSRSSYGAPPGGYAFMVAYDGALTDGFQMSPQAELVGPGGEIVPLERMGGGGNGRKGSWAYWWLFSSPTNSGTYLLRLKQKQGGAPLAEIHVGKL